MSIEAVTMFLQGIGEHARYSADDGEPVVVLTAKQPFPDLGFGAVAVPSQRLDLQGAPALRASEELQQPLVHVVLSNR